MWCRLLNDFILDSALDWDAETIKWYRKRLRPFTKFLKDNRVNAPPELRPGHVARFLGKLKRDGRAWSTRNGTYTACGVFVRWLALQRHIEHDFFRDARDNGLKRPRKPDTEPHTIKLRHIRAMISCAEEHAGTGDIFGIRDVVAMRLLIETGVRRAELVGIEIGNIDLVEGEIRLVGKFQRVRTVYFQNGTREALERWLEFRNRLPTNSDALLVSLHPSTKGIFEQLNGEAINDIVKKWRDNAGLPDTLRVNPHAWRATLASEWEGNAFDLQSILGHKHISTTQMYVRRSRSKVKNAAEKYTPQIDVGQ